MRKEGPQPNIFTYNAAISACEAASKRKESLWLYSLVHESGLCSHWHTSETNAVDLHELPLAVAKLSVAYVLEEFRSRRRRPPLDAPFEIITGRGMRSENSIAVVKPAVITMLAEDRYAALATYEVTGNPGRLRIHSAALAAWIEAAARGGGDGGVDTRVAARLAARLAAARGRRGGSCARPGQGM